MQKSWLNVKKLLSLFVPTHENIGRLLAGSWALMLLIVAIFLLTACSISKTQQNLPASLATKCEPALVFSGQSLGDLILYTADILEQYHICQAKQKAVWEWSNRA